MREAIGTGALTADELRTLDAMTARLIPTDETGPGAREARVSRYIDSALGSDYAQHRDLYRRGLSSTNAYARARSGAAFSDLAGSEQDAVLVAMERGDATPFDPPSDVFFARVRQHAIEGMFGDPAWGGNADRVGWALLGYTGPQAVWTAEQQRVVPLPARSAGGGTGKP